MKGQKSEIKINTRLLRAVEVPKTKVTHHSGSPESRAGGRGDGFPKTYLSVLK